METTSNAGGSFDPQADLDLLDRAKSTVHINNTLDFGPWWYAPLLATCVSGLTLFGHAATTLSSILYLVAGSLAGAIMGIHDYRRRTVRPKFSMQGAGLIVGIFIITWAMISLWSVAVYSVGYDRFMPGYAILGWLLTTVAFLVIRQASYALLARRTALT